MNPLQPVAAPVSAEKLTSLKQLTLVIYALYALSPFNGLTAIAAVIINYIKRDETAGTIYASHFTWQIRTFWWGLLWSFIGGITVLLGVGVIILLVNAVWLIYRVVRGFLNWNDNLPMPDKD